MGEIAIDETDPDGCTFTIQVKNRPYYLRATDKARCNDWVIILNRAREARLHMGNIQLATSTTAKMQQDESGGGDSSALEGGLAYRSQVGSDDYAQPCIVISALRPRTRALMNFDDEDDMQNLPPDLLMSNTAQDEEQIEVTKWDNLPSPMALQQHRHGVLGVVGSDSTGAGGVNNDDTQSIAKWQKRHSTWHALSVRFLRWARSISHHADACRRENDVMVVPSHVVMASQQKKQQPPAYGVAAATAGETQQRQGGPKSQKTPVSVPDLMDSTPGTPGAGGNTDSSTQARSRVNTESPSFGITYV